MVVDSRALFIAGSEEVIHVDVATAMREHAYNDATEEMDPKFPKPLIEYLATTIFVDSDHAHDLVTRRSCTGILVCVGRTPVMGYAKCQGAIATSTYGVEFYDMKTATEEAISLCYMLRCLGVNIPKGTPTNIVGDNRSVILNANIAPSLLKKKHVAIAYHMVRESVAAGIIRPLRTRSEYNFADIFTKALGKDAFFHLLNGFLRS